MIDLLKVRPGDRVLMISIADPGVVEAVAGLLTGGLLVGLGEDEEVRAARRSARDIENVMFVPAPPDDIPWQGSYFTKAVDIACRWRQPERFARELRRVLARGGTAYLAKASTVREYLLAEGFAEDGTEGPFSVFRLPG